MKPRDRCPRLFCSGTLYVDYCSPERTTAVCGKCGRTAVMDDHFRPVRPWLVGWGFLGWLLLVLWLPEVLT